MKHFDILSHILLLFGILVGVLAFVAFKYKSDSQFLVIILTTLFYLFWALAYHKIKGDLGSKLIIEYSILGLIAITCSFLIFVI